MINFNNQEYVRYPVPEVFAAGILPANWPKSQGVEFYAPERLGHGASVGARITIPHINKALHMFRVITFKGTVEEFEEEEHVLITGDSTIGTLGIQLAVSPHKTKPGTNVTYGTTLEPIPLPFPINRIFNHEVQKHLGTISTNFAAGLRGMVEDYISENSENSNKTCATKAA